MADEENVVEAVAEEAPVVETPVVEEAPVVAIAEAEVKSTKRSTREEMAKELWDRAFKLALQKAYDRIAQDDPYTARFILDIPVSYE